MNNSIFHFHLTFSLKHFNLFCFDLLLTYLALTSGFWATKYTLHFSSIIFSKDEFKHGLNCLPESGLVPIYFQHLHLKHKFPLNSLVPSKTIKREIYNPTLVVSSREQTRLNQAQKPKGNYKEIKKEITALLVSTEKGELPRKKISFPFQATVPLPSLHK